MLHAFVSAHLGIRTYGIDSGLKIGGAFLLKKI